MALAKAWSSCWGNGLPFLMRGGSGKFPVECVRSSAFKRLNQIRHRLKAELRTKQLARIRGFSFDDYFKQP